MKKILSILVCVCVLLSAMVFTASAADSTTYNKVGNVEDLTAGDYIMAAYITTNSEGKDLSANPYQCFTGSVGYGKLYTSAYAYTNGVLTTSESYEAVEVTLTAVEGKANTYTIYVDGKGYLVSTDSTNNHKLDFDNANSMDWTASNHSDGGIIMTASNGTVLGTGNAKSQFIRGYKAGGTIPTGMYFFIAGEVIDDGNEDVQPPVDEEETVEPVITLVDAPVAGTAYKFGMVQGNLNNTLYYITGVKGGYNDLYLATTTDAVAGADVYLEEVEGGYNLYTMVEGAKKYINMVVNGTYVNGEYEDAAATVYTYDAESKTVIATVNDAPYWFGTRNDKTYDTVGPCKTEYAGFYCQFYTVEVPDDYVPPVQDGEGDTGFDPTGKTAAEIVDAAYALAPGAAFSKAATLTGVITSVDTEFSSQYNNVTVTIAVDGASADKPIKCFRLKGEGADKIAVGDKITVTGIIKNYQHSSGDTEVEFDAGCTLDSYVKGEGTSATPEKEEEKKEEAKTEFGVVANPVKGTAYKFGMVQGNLNKTLYVTGEMDGFYMATTEDVNKAADVYLEETTGGYYIYAMVNGAKKYMGIEKAMGSDGKEHINAVYSDAPKSVFTYNATVKTFVTKVGDKEYGFGTRNDREYTTVSPSSTEYTDNFVCQFYGMRVVNSDGSTKAPVTGDNVGAIAVMAMAAAAIVIAASKKR